MKEMIIGSLRGQQSPLVISGQVVTQVSVFKLPGVTINNSLRWSDHIESMTSKASVFPEETEASWSVTTGRPTSESKNLAVREY